MEATLKLRPEKGEKPYEFCWRIHFDDGTQVVQYDEAGNMVIFDKQDKSGMVGITIFRHPHYEPESVQPLTNAVRKVCTPIFFQCKLARLRYQGRAVRDMETGKVVHLPRRRMVIDTDWMRVAVTPSGWMAKKPTAPGGAFEVSFKRIAKR